MVKPKVVLLSYHTHVKDLEPYVDLRYYNCDMPESEFYKVAKDADLILEQEFNDGKAKYGGLLQTLPKRVKKAVWLIDTHTRPDHNEYAKNFDHVFVAINRLRNKFDMSTLHMPLACGFGKDMVKPSVEPKKYDVTFVGQFLVKGGRRDTLFRLRDDLDKKKIRHNFTRAYGDDYIKFHQQGRVGFNKSIGKELNFRIFEVMAMGVPQVSDWNDECAHVKGLRDRIFWYNEYDEIIPKIELALSKNPKWIEDFIKDNQEWMLNNHMVMHRHLSMIEHCLGYSLRRQ